MSTISGIYYSTLSALNAYTCAIDVTSTNIANAENTDYSRQDTVLQTDGSLSTSGGVQVAKIKRIYDSYLTSQIWSANQQVGKWEAEQEILSDVEQLFTGTDADLESALSDFWNNWQSVVSDPSDTTERSVLASSAEVLADCFNRESSSLKEIQKNIDENIADIVDSINQDIQQIAGLNEKIAQAKVNGENENTYKDQLESLVTDLSSYININAYENDAGQICIQTSNGRSLVVGTTTWSLETAMNSTTGLRDICLVNSSGDSTVITSDISGGKLGGYLEVRDQLIPDYLAEFNEMAASIIEEVNALHTNGYDLEGNSGVAFFEGTEASDIAVNSDLLDDPQKIAASSTADGGSGDGSNASSIADLQNSLLLNAGTTTYSESYESLVSQIGLAAQSAESNYETQEAILENRQTLRDSVSAVSLDEETAKLILYQNVYEAAAKMMTVWDELLDTAIKMGT